MRQLIQPLPWPCDRWLICPRATDEETEAVRVKQAGPKLSSRVGHARAWCWLDQAPPALTAHPPGLGSDASI